MKIDRKFFLEALEKANVASANGRQDSELFILKNRTIYAYDGRVMAAVPFEHDLDCYVRSADLLKVVQKHKEAKEITIVQMEDSIEVKSGRSRQSLRTYDSELYSHLLTVLPATELEEVPIDSLFSEALHYCLLPDKQSDWSGLFMDNTGYAASDRRTAVVIDTHFNRRLFWFRHEDALTIQKLIEKGTDKWIVQDDSPWIFWVNSTNGEIFGVRSLLLDSIPFAMLRNLVDQTRKGRVVLSATLPEGVDGMLERSGIFASGPKPLRISLHDDSITFFTEAAGGSSTERLDLPIEWNQEEHSLTGLTDLDGLQFCVKRGLDFQIVHMGDARYALKFEKGAWTGLVVFEEESRK